MAALSDKDRKDLEFACELGVDWLALSFVQRPEDVIEARDLAKGRAAILSKIEKPAAVKAYDAILAVSDGIMVARGDLGVDDHAVRHAAQAHADEVEEPDLGTGQTGPDPDGQERQEEEDEDQQGAGGDPHDDREDIGRHGEGKSSEHGGR